MSAKKGNPSRKHSPDGHDEAFSNPLAPDGLQDDTMPMTNDDFRRLMMTPRVSSNDGSKGNAKEQTQTKTDKKSEKDDAALKRRQKKMFFAKMKKQEEERAEELRSKYRDRAAERRDNSIKDFDPASALSTTADYRAVAPTMDVTYAERRKQIIQESKYLGGDMEHTHLVKGLDYALLDKVRAEIINKEQADLDEELEEAMKEHVEREDEPEEEVEEKSMEVAPAIKSRMAKSIHRLLFEPSSFKPSELFGPRRMAYVVDLEDDFMESDIPTTLMRSKADCPNMEATTTLTTNDIVISKLTQILSYLRQGRRDRKGKKKDKVIRPADDVKLKPGPQDDSIYGEIGDYAATNVKKDVQPIVNVPRPEKDKYKSRGRDRDHRDSRDSRDQRESREYRDNRSHRDHREHREREPREPRDHRSDKYAERREHRKPKELAPNREDHRGPRKSYFEKPIEEDEDLRTEMRPPQNAESFIKDINEKFANAGWSQADVERERTLRGPGEDGEPRKKSTKQDTLLKQLKQKSDAEGYQECYPGMMEMVDATGDSDDEVDFTKMDQGNKKGPVGRWDFDTQEAYSDYMSQREALPKAAFQYGVKMADGRKTRRTGPKDEKAALDRQWQKIQKIMKKRQEPTQGGSAAKVMKH